MQRNKDTFYLFILAGIVLVGVLVLLALQRAISPELWTLAGIVVGGVAGLARQDSSHEPTQGVTIPGSVAPRVNITTAAAVSPAEATPAETAAEAISSPAAPTLFAGAKPTTDAPAVGSVWDEK